MVEIFVVLLGLTLLVLAFSTEQWLVSLGALVLGIAALAGLGLVAWVSLPNESRAVAAVVVGVIDGVKIVPEAAVLAFLGVVLVGLVFARRGCPS